MHAELRGHTQVFLLSRDGARACRAFARSPPGGKKQDPSDTVRRKKARPDPSDTLMVGGMVSSTVLTLAVIPAIYALVKQWSLKRGSEE